jgi:hypothetical protein
MAQLNGKVKGVPIVSHHKHSVRSSARPRARMPAPSRKPSTSPSNEAPPMPDIKEEEEAAPETACEPHAQLQPRPGCRLALDRVAEQPADVRVLLAQGSRSIYDDNEYIELPEAKKHVTSMCTCSS